jgi:hypothetical protein
MVLFMLILLCCCASVTNYWVLCVSGTAYSAYCVKHQVLSHAVPIRAYHFSAHASVRSTAAATCERIHADAAASTADNSEHLVNSLLHAHTHTTHITAYMHARQYIERTASGIVEALTGRIMYAGSKIRLNKARYLVYSIVDAIVDEIFPIVQHFHQVMVGLQGKVHSDSTTPLETVKVSTYGYHLFVFVCCNSCSSSHASC